MLAAQARRSGGSGRRSQALKAEPAGFPDGFTMERESQRGSEDEAKDEWDCRQPKGRKLKEAGVRRGDSELTLGRTDTPAPHPGQDAQKVLEDIQVWGSRRSLGWKHLFERISGQIYDTV